VREAAQLQAGELARRAAACPDLASLAHAVAECTACSLCKTRTQTVFADGTGRVRVLFVGEAPGENEDLQGVPFVGRAGALLTDIITKGMGLARQDVTIANVLKCRPPGNRDPSETEKLLCTSWLDRQIELVDPQVIIPLGRHAACHLLGSEATMGSLRGRVHERAGRKIVGSAQLRRTGAFLQHGSVLLEGDQSVIGRVTRGPAPPGADACLGAVLGRPVPWHEVAEALAHEAREWGGPWRTAGPEELAPIATRHEVRYRSDDWTWRR